MKRTSPKTAQAQELFSKGMSHHQAGRLAEAERLYRQALTLDPRHSDALHLLGVLAAQSGQPALAVERISQAIALSPDTDAYHCNLGLALAGLGRTDEAEAAYGRALKLHPNSPEALNNLGLLLRDAGRLAEAETRFQTLVSLAPNYPEGFNNLGLTLMDMGRMAQSEQAFQQAIALRQAYPEAHYNLGNLYQSSGLIQPAIACYQNCLLAHPHHGQAHNNLGLLLIESGRFAEAAAHLQRAVQLRPNHAPSHSNLGVALDELGRYDDAVASHRQAIALAPHLPSSHNNLGNSLKLMKRLDEAEASYRRALELDPGSADTLNNLGTALQLQGRIDDAVASYRQAIAAQADFAKAHYNLGVALYEQDDPDAAIQSYERALSCKPDYAEARSNMAMLQLGQSRWKEGWSNYECRWETPDGRKGYRHFPQPQWRGEAAVGKSLLIHGEQGFGDSLQFCRYASVAAQQGLKVTLAVQKPLVRLLKCLPGIEAVVDLGGPLPETDLHCPMLSLPLALLQALEIDTPDIPTPHPYLAPDQAEAERWKQRLGQAPGVKIGLVWAGNARLHLPNAAAIDRRRSLAPDLLEPLLKVPGCRFFSLQKDGPAAPDHFPLEDLMAEIGDFADTAALISQLDLVISVDTAVAHLAAAIGKPVWLLDRHDPCWRWLRNREDSPWYPRLRLFRQSAPGDWPGVIDRIGKALQDSIGA